jgi:hypothetical protein
VELTSGGAPPLGDVLPAASEIIRLVAAGETVSVELTEI